MALDPERRRQLHAMKLRSIVSAHLELSIEELLGTDDGASAKLSDGSVAVLAEERHNRALGGALASSARSTADEIHLFTACVGTLGWVSQLYANTKKILCPYATPMPT